MTDQQIQDYWNQMNGNGVGSNSAYSPQAMAQTTGAPSGMSQSMYDQLKAQGLSDQQIHEMWNNMQQ